MGFSGRDELLAALQDEDPSRREEAVYEIGVLRDASLLPALLQALHDAAARVRWRALQALGRVGALTDVAQAIIGLLQDQSSLVRGEAARLTGETRDPASVPLLVPLLDDPDLQVRCSAIEALGDIGQASEPLMARMLACLAHEDYRIRMHAAICLGKCRCAPALSGLIKALGDQNQNVRGFAAWSLGELREAKALVPLITALGDSGDSVRICVFQAIAALGQAAIAPLEQALESGKPEMRSLLEDLLRQLRLEAD